MLMQIFFRKKILNFGQIGNENMNYMAKNNRHQNFR